MQIEESSHGSLKVLKPAGRIDQATAAEFQTRLLAAMEGAAALLLDFSKVDYISSVGLRALMVAAKTSKQTGTRIGVSSLTPTVKEIFDISRFTFVVKVYANLKEAAEAIAPEQAAAF